MDYDLLKNSISLKEYTLDTVSEQPVDVDITLPDYCPDIEKILKCTLVPKIYTKNISGGQLSVDGAATIRIIYVDSNSKLRSFEYSTPFSASYSLKSTPEQYIVLIDTKSEYVNCRALSPRKLVIHGAFSLYSKVVTKKPVDFYSAPEDTDLQTRGEKVSLSSLCCLCEEQFTVSEDITVNDKPPVESIISSMLQSKITECKSIHNKIMLSTELKLHIMYLSDLQSGEIEHLSYVFPISRIIDCEGVEEDTVLEPSLSVMSYDIHVRNDAVNDGSLLNLDAKINFSALGYTTKDMDIITDAYSTDYNVDVTRSPVSAISDFSVKDFSCVEKSVVSLDNETISEVLDVYSDSLNISPAVSNGDLKILSKANICILAKNTDDAPFYIERNIDFENIFENINHDRIEDISGCIESISYRILDDNNIEVRLEINFKCVLSNSIKISPLTKISRLDDSKIEKDDRALILYYADKGENVWDISKAFSAKPDDLIAENSLDGDTIESKMMLLIPTA